MVGEMAHPARFHNPSQQLERLQPGRNSRRNSTIVAVPRYEGACWILI
jgi:hypothetical protein